MNWGPNFLTARCLDLVGSHRCKAGKVWVLRLHRSPGVFHGLSSVTLSSHGTAMGV